MLEIFENSFVQYTIYIIIFSLLSAFGVCICNLYANIYRYEEIEEVIFFNELSNICIDKHKQAEQRQQQQQQLLQRIILQPPKPFCDNEYCAIRHITRITYFIESAQFSIDVAMFNFNTLFFFDSFKRALQRGVRVRFIGNAQTALCSGSQILELLNFGASVRGPEASKNLMHHKFCICDGPARLRQMEKFSKNNDTAIEATTKQQQQTARLRSVVISGSMNWTKQSFNENWENCFITSNVNVIEKYQREFYRMWRKYDFAPKM